MNSNTNSKQSSSLSNKSDRDNNDRKRVRKRIRKANDGSRFGNLGQLPSKSSNNSREAIEETKEPRQPYQHRFQKRQSYMVESDSNNGFASDENSSQISNSRKISKRLGIQLEVDDPSDRSLMAKHLKVKVKVKKIDDEGVSNYFQIFIAFIRHLSTYRFIIISWAYYRPMTG
jgi:hypothetical protein